MHSVRFLQRLAFFGLLCLGAAAPRAAPTLQIASGDGPPLSTPNQTGFADRVTLAAFERIGRKAEIIPLPSQRALIEANQGIVDGDLLRVKEIPEIYTNLRRVPEKILDYEFMVFTRHLHFTPRGWDSVKPYNVGFITGWKIIEHKLRNSHNQTRGKDTRHVMQLLANDRVELVIVSRWLGLQAIRDLGLTDVYMLEPPLETRDMFLLLHKRHSDLLPKLAEALRTMKQDGTYQQLYNETLGHLLAPSQQDTH